MNPGNMMQINMWYTESLLVPKYKNETSRSYDTTLTHDNQTLNLIKIIQLIYITFNRPRGAVYSEIKDIKSAEDPIDLDEYKDCGNMDVV